MIRPAVLALTLALCLAAAAPAAAHWDKTRWGMTPEAVVALYPAAVPSGAPANRDPREPTLELPAPYIFEGQSFSMARLFFRDEGRLSTVELMTNRKADQLPGLVAWLERRHGKPLASRGSMAVPASGMAFYEADYAGTDGDRVKLNVILWANGDALSAVNWKPAG